MGDGELQYKGAAATHAFAGPSSTAVPLGHGADDTGPDRPGDAHAAGAGDAVEALEDLFKLGFGDAGVDSRTATE